MGKVVAIDFGLKRTGLAITDESKMIAFGLETVESKKLMDYLITLFKAEKIDTIVLGEPKRMDGSDAHVTQNVYLLKEALEKQFPGVPVVLQDERFTSKMAFNTMIEGGLKKKQRQNKAMIDKISATIILQEYLGGY
ncbi:MAG: Holliday junction resolvase RuvX [Crocinitomicaceae bacterium]|nr:Holliday junction resolvase RuvX [Crocinitomicaceae bacterium]